MDEIKFSGEFQESNEKEEEEDKWQDELGQLSLGKGVSYQIGIITEMFQHRKLQAYLNYFSKEGKTTPIPEDKIWLILIQMAEVLSFC